MSTVFSRRTFLKYTAVAAVAVAGSSLLGGCSGAETATSTEIGGVNTVLQVSAKLNSLTVADSTAIFELSIANGRRNAISVIPTRFAVKVFDKNNSLISTIFPGSTTGSIALEHVSGAGPQVRKGEECTYAIKATGLPEDTAALQLIYTPDTEYNEYTSNWILTSDKFNSSVTDGTETPSPEE